MKTDEEKIVHAAFDIIAAVRLTDTAIKAEGRELPPLWKNMREKLEVFDKLIGDR